MYWISSLDVRLSQIRDNFLIVMSFRMGIRPCSLCVVAGRNCYAPRLARSQLLPSQAGKPLCLYLTRLFIHSLFSPVPWNQDLRLSPSSANAWPWGARTIAGRLRHLHGCHCHWFKRAQRCAGGVLCRRRKWKQEELRALEWVTDGYRGRRREKDIQFGPVLSLICRHLFIIVWHSILKRTRFAAHRVFGKGSFSSYGWNHPIDRVFFTVKWLAIKVRFNLLRSLVINTFSEYLPAMSSAFTTVLIGVLHVSFKFNVFFSITTAPIDCHQL